MAANKEKSPNTAIDEAITGLMKKVKTGAGDDAIPVDMAVKIINSAIAWEKVKHQIKDDEPFDPDRL